MKTTKAITGALATLRAEYLRQLTDLAVELRPGFEAGLYGAETADCGGDPDPFHALCSLVKQRVHKDGALAVAFLAASPNRDRCFVLPVRSWVDALEDAVVVDLCSIAEAQRWTQWKAQPFFADSKVQPVPVKLPRRAA